ncbi:hypothetical protein HK098_006850 [Nowakowskiella sp. JEL0407]|nr:hypothetical protein HK098_006850 [Nowakowskiella sp. JEL0407]
MTDDPANYQPTPEEGVVLRVATRKFMSVYFLHLREYSGRRRGIGQAKQILNELPDSSKMKQILLKRGSTFGEFSPNPEKPTISESSTKSGVSVDLEPISDSAWNRIRRQNESSWDKLKYKQPESNGDDTSDEMSSVDDNVNSDEVVVSKPKRNKYGDEI